MDALRSSNWQKFNNRNLLAKLAIRNYLNSIASLVQSKLPKTVLDVGCGEGFVIRHLLNHNKGLSIRGIDCNEEALGFARKLNPEADFNLSNINETSFLDKTYDLVMCLEVLEHLRDVSKALAGLVKLTGRYCIISVPKEPYFSICRFLGGKDFTRYGRHSEHLQHFSQTKIYQIVGRYFNIEKIIGSFPWIIILGRNVNSKNGIQY